MVIFAAIYNFVGTDEHKLSLDVGDAVNIMCQSEGKLVIIFSTLQHHDFLMRFMCNGKGKRRFATSSPHHFSPLRENLTSKV